MPRMEWAPMADPEGLVAEVREAVVPAEADSAEAAVVERAAAVEEAEGAAGAAAVCAWDLRVAAAEVLP